jgi:hypothetical protein
MMRSHYKCEFCDSRATWNGITREHPRYTFICDEHFLSHCSQAKAMRFPDPLPDEQYTLTTIDEFRQSIEELNALYSAQKRCAIADARRLARSKQQSKDAHSLNQPE